MRKFRTLPSLIMSLMCLSLMISCSDEVGTAGDLVGGACDVHGDCLERCVRGDAFPDGMCTLNCRDQHDCPLDSVCVENSGGICILLCLDHGDCRHGYECDNVLSKDPSYDEAKPKVCIHSNRNRE